MMAYGVCVFAEIENLCRHDPFLVAIRTHTQTSAQDAKFD